MDIVFIEQLTVETVIGIYDWEREIRQQVVLDLEMGTDNRAAAAADDFEQALDYESISKRITGFVETSRVLLVETLAEQVAQLVMQEFGVRWVRLRLNKPGAVKNAQGVGVVIERGERS